MVESSASSSGDSSPTDPYAAAWARVAEAIVEAPGSLPPDVRRAIVGGDDPPELVPLLDKVRRHAYRITDADVAGLDVDATLEAVIAAALGEGELRRRAALEAIG
jgi:hypothetical protein